MSLWRRPAHRATTATLEALHPFHTSHPAAGGVFIGADLHGGAFTFDPWTWYRAGRITNPNMLITGPIGRGKSSLVKTLIRRSSVLGVRAAVLDPKGEYAPLAHAMGVEPIRLVPGGASRLNPLDPGPGAAHLPPEEITRRRLALLDAAGAAALHRDLTPTERAATRLALAATTTSGQRTGVDTSAATIPAIAAALLEPAPSAAASIQLTKKELIANSRDLALELHRLCDGDLRGMFDGPTTIDVDWDGPLITIDLAAVANTPALPILMACATAWLHTLIARPDAGPHYLVLDEAWRFLNHLGTARWLQASLKLARQYQLANILVIHRESDLETAGDAGSELTAIAQGLLNDMETRVDYGSSSGVGQRGLGHWSMGLRQQVILHRVGPGENRLIAT